MEDLQLKFNNYRNNLSHAFSELRMSVLEQEKTKHVESIIDLARRYYEDAAYFRGNGQMVTALVSLAYSEGLLDGLRLLGYVHFSWKAER